MFLGGAFLLGFLAARFMKASRDASGATQQFPRTSAASTPSNYIPPARPSSVAATSYSPSLTPAPVPSGETIPTVKISDSQIDARLKQIKQQYFKGDESKYQQQLKTQGLTETQVKDDIRAQLLSEAIYKNVTKGVTVSDSDIRKYYDQHKSQYETGESRDVLYAGTDSF